METSNDSAYTERLLASESGWRSRLGVQAPYRWHIRRRASGHVLDVGCGIGRNLAHLGGNGIGVDTNRTSVEVARRRGLRAYTPEEFASSPDAAAATYDTLLFSHVLEHMTGPEASNLVADYLPYLRPGGMALIIVPQEVGFRSDPTHVDFVSERDLEGIARAHGLEVERIYSFPFPRWVGRIFRHNETVGLFRLPS